MQQKNAQSSQKDIVVKVGVYNLEDWGDDITVTRTLTQAYIHESYNASSLASKSVTYSILGMQVLVLVVRLLRKRWYLRLYSKVVFYRLPTDLLRNKNHYELFYIIKRYLMC